MPSVRTLSSAAREMPDQPWWPEWTERARCRDYDPEIFFDLGAGRNPVKIKKAKAVCFGCPVIRKCLRDNLRVPYGIFGGLTPYERERLILELDRRKRHASPSVNDGLEFSAGTKIAPAPADNVPPGGKRRGSSEALRRQSQGGRAR